jgi:hypothetical protein
MQDIPQPNAVYNLFTVIRAFYLGSGESNQLSENIAVG